MPSMKCYQCSKTKRCRMVMVRNLDVGFVPTLSEQLGRHPEYLCTPCGRELGYWDDTRDEGGEA